MSSSHSPNLTPSLFHLAHQPPSNVPSAPLPSTTTAFHTTFSVLHRHRHHQHYSLVPHYSR
ncbi:hypothetical protein E2C01_066267 [Portunus trituberculatus]|uniref:Uncharacterized protein n=1 Tax=Portunus trituberculatus TaxID=210409 RepID=A0A5B7HQK5_PORTR|nr:hypothetical protein [Portunus trituberculatus]